ncbi:MAG: phenylalanine--tRNA ligase subunit beta [Chitinophagaceae bacterium]|nr:phenylalanine--tRNA ligase subunit beta [Chitinophagaceae bacterium]
MTISYNWISEYIPLQIDHEKISKILTSIGLEVESMERFESIRGGLAGLIVGEVKEAFQHPGADKLKLTKVDVGNGEILQIVCGAPNVAAGQKVIVAREGTTIYPVKGDPVTMKKAKIRGEESFGMICAEDEVGIGENHEGIIILPADLKAGTPISEYYKPYTDWIYEIGLTPNRMDAMSHYGVARDICAYLSHHENKEIRAKNFSADEVPSAKNEIPFTVKIENTKSCKRYSGVCIAGIEVKPSPQWLQDKLRAIGQRPINNIVDITNFILHDTGQPLHAFDAAKVAKNTVIVKNLPPGSTFKTLDGKERNLNTEDLMICDGNEKGMCIAGVFGGIDSGVTPSTKNIFLESAWFNPVDIRKTSFRHGLRTDAAMRFEKNVDISNCLNVLKRAAMMIVELAGGRIAGDWIDVYPSPDEKSTVVLGYEYMKKLSGKKYEPQTVKNILSNLGFGIRKESENEVEVEVPYSKPDITLPADVVEEVMRIDGYDNIAIPSSITITPSVGGNTVAHIRKEKVADYLVGAGFSEIFTNSITNAAYFEDGELAKGVRLLNNLSAVHNLMRPSMLQTGLESVAYNINRKNHDLRFFEFGKTYHNGGVGKYFETEHLCLFVTGNKNELGWKGKAVATDVFYVKGIVEAALSLSGVKDNNWDVTENPRLRNSLVLKKGSAILCELGTVAKAELQRFDIKQEIFFADIRWNVLMELTGKQEIKFVPLPNQLSVQRDLAMVVPRSLPFKSVGESIKKINLSKLKSVKLFDVFESDKLGADKKSFAINFTFLDEEKTLTDKEIESMMNRIMLTLEKDLNAEIRKGS